MECSAEFQVTSGSHGRRWLPHESRQSPTMDKVRTEDWRPEEEPSTSDFFPRGALHYEKASHLSRENQWQTQPHVSFSGSRKFICIHTPNNVGLQNTVLEPSLHRRVHMQWNNILIWFFSLLTPICLSFPVCCCVWLKVRRRKGRLQCWKQGLQIVFFGFWYAPRYLIAYSPKIPLSKSRMNEILNERGPWESKYLMSSLKEISAAKIIMMTLLICLHL